MYRTGHYGVSLLVFAPVGAALVAAGRPVVAAVTGATMLWLAGLPDLDHRVPGLAHRGVTHTLAFALLVGLVFAGLGVAVGGRAGVAVAPTTLGAAGLALGLLTVGAHLLGDLLTPMGVALLWPLSDRRFSLDVTPADSRLWNYGLFAAGLFVTAVAGAAVLRTGAGL